MMELVLTKHAVEESLHRMAGVYTKELKEQDKLKKLIIRDGKFYYSPGEEVYYCNVNNLMFCVFRKDKDKYTLKPTMVLVTLYPYTKKLKRKLLWCVKEKFDFAT